MKKSKKILMWLGIANVIAAAALTVTTCSLFSNANKKNINKSKYNKKISDIDVFLASDIKDDKYNKIKKELEDEEKTIKSTITSFSNQKDYDDATAKLQDALDKAKAAKLSLDSSNTNIDDAKEQYEAKRTEAQNYSTNELAEDKYESIKNELDSELTRIQNLVDSASEEEKPLNFT
ncbi:hypothetical protein [Mycoplasmopsis arginini]|uniref:hypothetical protein n=1 Tax=Mycoplasmopsis arginini TaxID=2094 RepID=UPI003D06CAAC